jgi:mRNA interferase RelE/StbE
MEIIFLDKFEKDIDKIKSKSVKSSIIKIIEHVEKANSISEIKNLKKLKGFSSAYRIRMGDFRIGVFIEENKVEFARIIHRKDIYKMFP